MVNSSHTINRITIYCTYVEYFHITELLLNVRFTYLTAELGPDYGL